MRVILYSPVVVSHNLTVSSQLPVASTRPSGLKATEVTACVCPTRVALCCPVEVSHNRPVLSALAVASVCPSGLKARLSIYRVCPFSVVTCWRLVRCHRCTTVSSLSPLVLANSCLSGLKTVRALDECMLSKSSASPVCAS